MLAEQAQFLWWNYYIIHLHQLTSKLSPTYHDCNWPAKPTTNCHAGFDGVEKLENYKTSMPASQSHQILICQAKAAYRNNSLTNFLRHCCSNSRKIPHFPLTLPPSINSIEFRKETGHTIRIRIRCPHTAKYETEQGTAPLWMEIPEIINGIIWRLCVENSMKIAQKRNTDWRWRKKGTQSEWKRNERGRERKNLIELDPDDREMMMSEQRIRSLAARFANGKPHQALGHLRFIRH